MLASTEQKGRQIAIEQLLQEEHEERQDRIVEIYRADRNDTKYSSALRSANKTYRHMMSNVKDYFELS
jgi:hypothetical protein